MISNETPASAISAVNPVTQPVTNADIRRMEIAFEAAQFARLMTRSVIERTATAEGLSALQVLERWRVSDALMQEVVDDLYTLGQRAIVKLWTVIQQV